MAANFVTVKLARALVDEARREAELLHRSLGGQIEHWATLGRAVENARAVWMPHVRQALAGEPPLGTLDALDQEAASAISSLHPRPPCARPMQRCVRRPAPQATPARKCSPEAPRELSSRSKRWLIRG